MQRHALLLTAAAVSVAGLVSYAWAQTVPTTQTVLVSPALQLGNPTLGDTDYNALCMATNVTFEARRIQLQIFDGQGVRTRPPAAATPAPGATPSPTPTAIGAFQAAILSDNGYDAPASALLGLRYCVVIVNGEADDVRASFCLTERPEGNCITTVEAR